MATGYTYGILEGKTATFKQFATECMRAFGATMHMRDDSLDKPYEPRVVSDYYLKRIEETENEFADFLELSDEQILSKEKERVLQSIRECEESIKNKKENLKRLKGILDDVNKFIPPTKEHVNFKNFMIQQLEETITYDGDTKYDEKWIKELKKELSELNPKELRNEKIKTFEKDLAYYKKGYAEEVAKCQEANKWVTDLLKALEV